MNIKNEIKIISKKYNVKIIFKNLIDLEGNVEAYALYDVNIKTIFIHKAFIDYKEIISFIFHELGHKHCFEKNLFYSYHHENDKRLFKLTALKAERFVDRWAAREMKNQGYKFKYPYFYYKKERTKLMKEEILRIIKNIK